MSCQLICIYGHNIAVQPCSRQPCGQSLIITGRDQSHCTIVFHKPIHILTDAREKHANGYIQKFMSRERNASYVLQECCLPLTTICRIERYSIRILFKIITSNTDHDYAYDSGSLDFILNFSPILSWFSKRSLTFSVFLFCNGVQWRPYICPTKVWASVKLGKHDHALNE